MFIDPAVERWGIKNFLGAQLITLYIDSVQMLINITQLPSVETLLKYVALAVLLHFC